jgi:hypothetical protein
MHAERIVREYAEGIFSLDCVLETNVATFYRVDAPGNCVAVMETDEEAFGVEFGDN